MAERVVVRLTAAAITVSNEGRVRVGGTAPLGTDLTAIEQLTGTGLVTRTATTPTYTTRSVAKSGDGLAVTNGDGVSGNPTIALADDVAAIEALSGTGYAKRTASNTWELASITTTSQTTITPSTRQDDLDLGSYTDIRIEPTASVVITSIVAGSAGAEKMLRNVGTYLVVLACGPALGTAANRLQTEDRSGGSVCLFPGDAARIVYDGTDSRWTVVQVRSLIAGTARGSVRRLLASTGATLAEQEVPISSGSATIATPTPAATSLIAAKYRLTATTNTTLDAVSGIRGLTYHLIPAGSGFGGLGMMVGTGYEVCPNTSADTFIGITNDASAGVGASYSALTDMMGVGHDNGDANWQIMVNDASGTATKRNLGTDYAVAAGSLLRVVMYWPSSASRISWAVWREDDTSKAPVVGDETTNLPTAAMAPWFFTTNRSAHTRTIMFDEWDFWTP